MNNQPAKTVNTTFKYFDFFFKIVDETLNNDSWLVMYEKTEVRDLAFTEYLFDRVVNIPRNVCSRLPLFQSYRGFI